ncbi:FAD-dependent oxidoreductase [Limnospira platensis]|uniref:FAD-dependent oxidoreductase n=1 Tax=Limnospira platensis TaxID=118562 RepID=UPI003D6F7B4F
MSNPSPMVLKSDRIVIVGAGFGGLTATRLLAKAGANVLLIDRNCYHTFIPLLYQVATGLLYPHQIVYPLQSAFKKYPNVEFIQTNVEGINDQYQWIDTDHGQIRYDILVIATGSRPQLDHIPGAAQYSLTLNTLQDAAVVRHHIVDRIRRAILEPEPIDRARLLTFVIVGGGPTGIELAGGLIDQLRALLGWRRLFPLAKVILVHSGDRLLPNFSQRFSAYCERHLRQLGVSVWLNRRVLRVNSQGVELDTGEAIAAPTIIWTAGVQADHPSQLDQISTAAKGKIIVEPILQVRDHPKVYAIGDVAFLWPEHGLSGIAPEAIQQGEAVATNILHQLRGTYPQPFRYIDKGKAAIISRYAGILSCDRLNSTGFWGWLTWLVIHLSYLPGWRNRLTVGYNWFWDCVLGLRLLKPILPPYREIAFLNSPDPAMEFFKDKSQRKRSHLLSQDNWIMNYIPLIGRAFLATIFINSSVSKILDFAATEEMIALRGLPHPNLMLLGNIVFQLVGAFSLILGYKTRWGAIILILFLIPTTLVFHNFLDAPGEKTAFLKNLALIGSLMMVSYFGPGPVSLDERV